jgi:hypothetical protein
MSRSLFRFSLLFVACSLGLTAGVGSGLWYLLDSIFLHPAGTNLSRDATEWTLAPRRAPQIRGGGVSWLQWHEFRDAIGVSEPRTAAFLVRADTTLPLQDATVVFGDPNLLRIIRPKMSAGASDIADGTGGCRVVISGAMALKLADGAQGAINRSVTVANRICAVAGVVDSSLKYPSPSAAVFAPLELLRNRPDAEQGMQIFTVLVDLVHDDLARAQSVMERVIDSNRYVLNILPVRDVIWGARLADLEWTLWGALALVFLVGVAASIAYSSVELEYSLRSVAIRGALGATRWRLSLWWLSDHWPILLVSVIIALLTFSSIFAVRFLEHPALYLRSSYSTMTLTLGTVLSGWIIVGVFSLWRIWKVSEQLPLLPLVSGPSTTAVSSVTIAAGAFCATLSTTTAAAVWVGLGALYQVDLAFDWRHLVAVETNLSGRSSTVVFNELSSTIASVGLISALPLKSTPSRESIAVNGMRILSGADRDGIPAPLAIYVEGGALQALRPRLVAGELPSFVSAPSPSESGCVVSSSAAEVYFPDSSVLGKTFDVVGPLRRGVSEVFQTCRVVGVIADLRFERLDRPSPQVFLPFRPAIRGTVFAISRPQSELRKSLEWDEVTGQQLFISFFRDWHVWAFAVALFWMWATLTSLVAIIAMAATGLTERRHDIAICVTLGASTPRAIFLLLRRSIVLSAISCVVGAVFGLLLTDAIGKATDLTIARHSVSALLATGLVLILVTGGAIFVVSQLVRWKQAEWLRLLAIAR